MPFTIGSFVLYCQSGSNSPRWPALVCPEDMAPQEFLDTNPRTYMHLILLIGEELTFRWALTKEMHEYTSSIPLTDEETVGNTPGLGEAYAMVNSAAEARLGLDHWRRRVREELIASSSDSENLYTESSPDLDEDLDDPDLRMAIEQSRLEFEKVGRLTLSMPSSSPPMTAERANKVVITLDSDDDSDDDLRAPQSRAPYLPPISTSRRPASQMNCPRKSPRAVPCQASPPKRFAPRSFADGLNLKRLSETSTAPESDVIDGDIEASKTYVRVRVGMHQEQRMLPKACVWNRPYFRESNAGIMYFSMDNDGIYELKHPGLADVDADDFAYVAEYLESGQFGYVNPQGADQENETFSQIVAAWTVAEALGMTDMMEHVIDKLERLAPWDLWHVMFFACTVYGSAGISLPAQDKIKNILATDIAENYWIYIEDDHLSADFIQRLKDLPVLDRDIAVRRTAMLDGRLQQD